MKLLIITNPDEHGNMQVQVGIMKITSNLKNLRLQKEEKVSVVKSESRKVASEKSSNISPQIDLRGQVLEEAIINADKYLDDAYLSGLNVVTIVHGKGTGVLRSGIHQFLKGHPHIKAFRLGRYGEGETGVTIVELK
jgi:DNA mismatch repair protein MutS2